jgi:hypothetical protein
MSFSLKILPALALAVALSPVAAQARSAGPAPQLKYYLAPIGTDHATPNNKIRISEVMPGSATIDQPTVVYSGVTPTLFPDSVGG